MSTEYIVILVDKMKSAQEITQAFRPHESSSLKVEAFAIGHQLHGLQYRGTRPTKVIDLMTEREGEYFERWYDARVKPVILMAEVERLRREISFIAHVDLLKNAYDAEHIAVSVKSWALNVLDGVNHDD